MYIGLMQIDPCLAAMGSGGFLAWFAHKIAQGRSLTFVQRALTLRGQCLNAGANRTLFCMHAYLPPVAQSGC